MNLVKNRMHAPCTTKLRELPAWKALTEHYASLSGQRMADWFASDPQRFERFSLQLDGILFDYSKNRIQDSTHALLIRLAEESGLKDKISQIFSGQAINRTENRAVLHTALRAPKTASIEVQGKNIMPAVIAAREQMRHFSDSVRNGKWLGATGKPVRDIVNIGIGGSDLGPRMAVTALSAYATEALRCYFISDVDAAQINAILHKIDPERSLFIISSKSFTTPETRLNAETVKQWLQSKLQTSDLAPHFVAVTSARHLALQQGIPETQIFPLWDWVGGRFSVWSPIGLPLALMIGMTHFEDFLAGAHEVDQHFQDSEFDKNIPVLMALLGLWNINFHGAHAHVIAPYASELHFFRDHIQQLDMESNGKRVNGQGETLDYATGPVILGEQGCDSQHSFFQLLHQGPAMIPVDFILQAATGKSSAHHDVLTGSALSQAKALMIGKSAQEALTELLKSGVSEEDAKNLAKHKTLPGNRPSNVIFIDKISPNRLGKLIALYEHKIFVQGVIWQINSFDQWGVELGKQLLPDILAAIHHSDQKQDSSTQGLINYYQKQEKA